MEVSGNLLKMETKLNQTVQYHLILSDNKLLLNDYLGKKISLEYLGEINCIKCGRKTSKSFSQGFCFPCFQTAPETEDCVLRPELCLAHEGIARDMEFAESHCLIDHFVYLSRTDAIKVGVTRNTQIPTRWIDQGAIEAIILAKTPNRYTAGLIEVALKNHLPDKTNWRNMLTGKITDDRTLTDVKRLVSSIGDIYIEKYFYTDDSITTISYPLLEKPVKIGSLDLEKTTHIEGVLTGIKGQYLIFDNTNVINIRKFGGYKVKWIA
jgi:hypothetical protein